MNDNLAALCAAGLALVPIPPFNGKPTKAPTVKGWNRPKGSKNPGGYSANTDDFINCIGFNFGLYHGASNTLALDLDDIELARRVFEDTTNLDLLAWLENDVRIEVKSPKKNRGKLLFKLPTGFADAGLRQLKHRNKTVFELRSGNCQDVIHGQHPEGGDYQLIGNPAAIPPVPPVLLDMLQHWDAWKPCFDSALGILEHTPPKIAPQRPQQGEQLSGWRNPIQAFNQSHSVQSVLLSNGYRQARKDRFIRPGSESKAPGAVIMRNCADGIERIYSHGGDALNDGFSHDAFDCFCLLEHGGDYAKALDWNPDITKNNQRLYIQEQAKIKPDPSPCNEGHQGRSAPKERLLFPLVRANELTAKPMPFEWLLDGIIEQGSLNLLFGEPGSGKSLFSLDWAFCMASGIDWHGVRTKQTSVIVIAGEGFSGIGRRLKALEIKYGQNAPKSLFISKRPADFLDDKNVKWLADSIAETCISPGFVIIDTMHRNMTGDENSSQDIGKFISNIDVFLKPMGAAVLVVHHSGHGQKDRSRGSSSIKAAMDGEFSATLNNGGITLACHKAKDFEAFKPMQFALKTTELDWLNQDGEPLTSVVLEHKGEVKAGNQKRKLSARDESILTSLSNAICEHGIEPTAEIKASYGGFDGLANQHRKIVTISHWRVKAYKVIPVDCENEDNKPDALKRAFKRCRDKLFNGGFIVEHRDYAWRIYD